MLLLMLQYIHRIDDAFRKHERTGGQQNRRYVQRATERLNAAAFDFSCKDRNVSLPCKRVLCRQDHYIQTWAKQ